MQAAVDGEGVASGERRRRRHQPERGIGDLARLTESADRTEAPCRVGRVATATLHRAAQHRGVDRAGADGVHTDPVVRVVEGRAAGEAEDRMLAGGVGGLVVLRTERVGGRDVDDRARSAAVEHRRDLVLHRQEHTADVDAHHAIEVVVAALGQWHRLELDRCGVDRCVEATGAVQRGGDHRRHVVADAHVAGDEVNRTRVGRCGCQQCVGAGIGEVGCDHGRTGAGEPCTDRTSHAAGRSSDDRSGAGEAGGRVAAHGVSWSVGGVRSVSSTGEPVRASASTRRMPSAARRT